MFFYYPNRPTLVPPDPKNPLVPSPDYINSLEATGRYIGEYKWNGDNTEVHTDNFSFWNRDKKRLCYTPPPAMIEELKRFPRNSILNGELMHRHTKTVKDLLILHCVMAWDGEILYDARWDKSRVLLEGCPWLPRTVGTGLSYDRHVLLAEVHKTGFWNMFQKARSCDESIEGIVLKDVSGKIKISTNPIGDVSWMLKIRKPCKKYRF